jgi:predicted secreted hydrolase
MKAATIALSILLTTSASSLLNAQTTDAFVTAGEQPYHFEFPRDLYDHPSYDTEWWYFTGNLRSLNGRQYGFELTFFRSYAPTGAPAGQPQYLPIIFADLGVSDLDGQQFFFHKALAPETPPLASITKKPWTIQLGEWTLKEPNDPAGVFRLHALQDDFGVNLDLLPEMAPVLNGDKGSFKLAGSDGQGPEFYEYYSIPRLATSGWIQVNGERIPVEGLTWNDHEFFTLGANQTFPSWDWFSIQLENGTSIMLYGLRLPNGDFDPASRGTFVDRDGTVIHLKPGDFTLTPVSGEIWHSVASNADYPIAWTISIPSLKIKLEMSTPLQNQEMAVQPSGGSPAYWEGASRFRGSERGKPV